MPAVFDWSTRDGRPSKNSLTLMSETLPQGTTTSGSSGRRVVVGGRKAANTSASTGETTQTYSAVRRLVASATLPSTSAAVPPRPSAKPIVSPDAIPTWRGRYSCAITAVTPNVPTTQAPTSARATAPGTPPTATKTRISGAVTTTLPTRIER